MACWQRDPWWLRLTCFFFFGGLSCFIPFLTAHLKWLGLELSEIAAINLISAVFSAVGLLLAASWTPRCGHRSNLAVSILLAAFCAAGMLLVPRIQGRGQGLERDRAVTEILCRPEGSVLFFRQCGTSCDLDTTVRTELVISDCRFEAQSKLPARNWLNWINHVPFPDSSVNDSSEPERGDLPQKVVDQSPEGSQSNEDEIGEMEETEEQFKSQEQWTQENYDVDPFEVDDPNPMDHIPGQSIDSYYHNYDDYADHSASRIRRQDQTKNEDYEVETELPYLSYNDRSSPHICFSSHSTTTTCHVFIGTNHAFRFNTSFYSGIKEDGICFYSLRYDDIDQHILSELSCRSNKPDNQVRCRAEGVNLRASVNQNGTSAGACSLPSNHFHFTFWLYLIFRTLGEIAVVAAVVLLPIVALNDQDEKEAFRRMGPSEVSEDDCQQQEMNQRLSVEDGAISNLSGKEIQQTKTSNYWWIWSLAGLMLFGPVAGLVSQVAGFGVGFLLGSGLFGLASFMIALSPPRQQPRVDHSFLPTFRIATKDLCEILSERTAVGILMLMLFFGMDAAVVHTAFYWYLIQLSASRLLLGVALATSLILVPIIFPFKSWLWRKCGDNYVFIIGLLLYAIRFFGYSLMSEPVCLVTLETLEPLCSSWMLLTAAAKIGQLEPRKQLVRKVNIWALIILFHYSFGRGLGGLFSSMAAHHFGVMSVFVGSAMMSLFAAAFWLTLLHAIVKPQRKFRLFGRPPSQQDSSSNDFSRRGH